MQPLDNTLLIAALERAAPGRVRTRVSLREISRWGIGGDAAILIEPGSIPQLSAVLKVVSGREEPLVVVGDMSNVLFDSSGVEGVVLRIGASLAATEVSDGRLLAEAGISVPQVARLSAEHGLSGLEHTVGIPGTLGGLVVMNGGSQRKGIGSNVERVLCLDRSGEPFWLTQDECEFGYRRSALQTMAAVVAAVELRLEPADPREVHDKMDAVVASRRSRFPEDSRNCGSTFVSDPAMYETVGPPGRAIESAGLKGYSYGGALVSPQHANFIVNTGSATSDDILHAIAHVRAQVHSATSFWMDCEVRYIGPDGSVAPAHVVADALAAKGR